MTDDFLGREVYFQKGQKWLVVEKLDDTIYAIHTMFSFGLTAWPGYEFSAWYDEDFCFRNISDYTSSGNAKSTYDNMSYAEADHGRDSSGKYDTTSTEKDGLYLVPVTYYTDKLPGLDGYYTSQLYQKAAYTSMGANGSWTGSHDSMQYYATVITTDNFGNKKTDRAIQYSTDFSLVCVFNLDTSKVNIAENGAITAK